VNAVSCGPPSSTSGGRLAGTSQALYEEPDVPEEEPIEKAPSLPPESFRQGGRSARDGSLYYVKKSDS